MLIKDCSETEVTKPGEDSKFYTMDNGETLIEGIVGFNFFEFLAPFRKTALYSLLFL